MVPVIGSKHPYDRLTITPKVIKNANEVFILGLGDSKQLIYTKAISDPENYEDYPARLVLNRNWIFGV